MVRKTQEIQNWQYMLLEWTPKTDGSKVQLFDSSKGAVSTALKMVHVRMEGNTISPNGLE